MALAIHLGDALSNGEFGNYAGLARAGHISTARLSQILSLNNLAPCILEKLLFLPPTLHGCDRITERQLRQLARETDWSAQCERFARLNVSA